jgi:hypothetical protein
MTTGDQKGDHEIEEEYIRFPIISFKIKGLAASYVNVLLNDLFGIQVSLGSCVLGLGSCVLGWVSGRELIWVVWIWI